MIFFVLFAKFAHSFSRVGGFAFFESADGEKMTVIGCLQISSAFFFVVAYFFCNDVRI